MALDASITQTQIQSVGLSSNVVLSGVTTVSALNSTNAVFSGIVTATGGVVANVIGNVTGNLTGNVTGNLGVSGNVTATGGVTASNGFNAVTVPFFRNTPTIAANYTVTTTYNEMSIGPITIQTGVTVTVDSGATWTVV